MVVLLIGCIVDLNVFLIYSDFLYDDNRAFLVVNEASKDLE